MIITQLNGGLGNQMFQYALGRVLALKNKAVLYFDITPFGDQPYTDTKRDYALDVYDLKAKIADENLLNKFGRPNKYKLILNQYFKLGLNPYPTGYIKQMGHSFQKKVLESKGNIYLSGWWQSHKYFKKYESVIRRDFASRTQSISETNRSLTDDIVINNSVSLHVRRTDYVDNPATNLFHGTCDLEYYKKAMKMIETKIKNPVYYIFSDDPQWTRANIKSKHKSIYVSHNQGLDSHEDIRLMAKCKHNIIANSSFSWWGAWLNKNQNKIVVAPQKWILNIEAYNPDLIPPKWTRL